MEFKDFTISDIVEKVQSKEVKASEVVEYFINRCESINPNINAIIQLSEQARQQAKTLDEKDSSNMPLAGVPILLKDMFCTRGVTTTAASNMLKSFIPPYSSTVAQRLEDAGAILIGKCNQDEFAMGSSNETSSFGPTKNPWDFKHVPGGSSGGSAAAVAARLAPISIGTDTGGSIRQPASFCGVFGLKPTYGRVSRFGIVAFASSFDQAGPLSNRVADSATVLEVIAGKDERDNTTSDVVVPNYLKKAPKKLKIARLNSFFNDQVNEEILSQVNKSINVLAEQGCEIVDIDLKYLDVAVDTYYLLAMSEASSNLSRYDGVRYGYRADFNQEPPKNIEDFYSRTRSEGFGKEVKRRIALGTYALSSGYFEAYFLQAAKVRRLLQKEFIKAFADVDLIVSPVTTQTAFKLGEKINNPLEMYNNDVFTTCVNLAGLPAASVPIGFDKQNLPIGLQVIGNFFEEDNIFQVSQWLEDHHEFYKEEPNV